VDVWWARVDHVAIARQRSMSRQRIEGPNVSLGVLGNSEDADYPSRGRQRTAQGELGGECAVTGNRHPRVRSIKRSRRLHSRSMTIPPC
jgi:hypothetical protein